MVTEHDMPALLAALDFQGVREVTSTAGDSGAGTWCVRHAGGTVAVRVFPVGQAADVAREGRVMQVARAAGLPVPAIERMADWQGHPVMMLEWLPGRTIAAELAARPWRAWHLGKRFGQMHAAIHQIAAPADVPTWLDWLGDADRPLRQQLAARQPPSGPRLLHLDYHPMNVLTDGERITGVLDWTNALVGDPRADAARTVTILRLDSGPPAPAKSAILWAFEQGWRGGYTQAGGVLRDMARFYTWAGAVMAADLAPKRTPDQLARVDRWTTHWHARMSEAH